MTTGPGMIALHEYFQTSIMGALEHHFDVKTCLFDLDIADIVGNKIRKQMGDDWGQRTTYAEAIIGRTAVTPFTKEAMEAVLRGEMPKSGYVGRPASTNGDGDKK